MPIIVKPGAIFVITLPYSEVMMHMRKAGTRAVCRLNDTTYPSVDLLGESLDPICGPVLPCEAGLYQDGLTREYYYYQEEA